MCPGNILPFQEVLVVSFQFFSSADLFLDLSGAIQTPFHEACLWNVGVSSLSCQSEQEMQLNQNRYFTEFRTIRTLQTNKTHQYREYYL